MTSQKKIKWYAIGDSFTYLNDHPEETGYRAEKGYLSRVSELVPQLDYVNAGINGSTTRDWLEVPVEEADFYTILLGTNDWKQEIPLGNRNDYLSRTAGTILGNLGCLVGKIRQLAPEAPVLIMNPVERGDFIYIDDYHNHSHGSYVPAAGQWLKDISAAIYKECREENVHTLNLHDLSGFCQENVVTFKRVRVNEDYQNLTYPDYTEYPFDPESDLYPYPTEAIYFTYDGLHPSDKGNQILADLIAAKIKEIL